MGEKRGGYLGRLDWNSLQEDVRHESIRHLRTYFCLVFTTLKLLYAGEASEEHISSAWGLESAGVVYNRNVIGSSSRPESRY